MFKGSLVALITPFRDGAVDETAFQEHVAWQLGQGTHGLVPIGTTGPEWLSEVVAAYPFPIARAYQGLRDDLIAHQSDRDALPAADRILQDAAGPFRREVVEGAEQGPEAREPLRHSGRVHRLLFIPDPAAAG